MTVQPSVITNQGSANSLKLVVWTVMANGDSGTPFLFADWADRAMQITGTFGAGGTVVFEGSNDGVNYATLNDTSGVALSLTSAGIRQMNEAPLMIRPRVTAGDGTTALVASVLGRRLTQTSI